MKSLVIFSLVFFMAGCTVHRAQVATQSALTATAEGVAGADTIVALAIPEASARVVEQVSQECGVPCSDGLDRFQNLMGPYYQAVTALESAGAGLRALQGAFDIWVATGDLPNEWSSLCGGVGLFVVSLIESLDFAGLDVPEALTRAGPSISSVCDMIVGVIQ